MPVQTSTRAAPTKPLNGHQPAKNGRPTPAVAATTKTAKYEPSKQAPKANSAAIVKRAPAAPAKQQPIKHLPSDDDDSYDSSESSHFYSESFQPLTLTLVHGGATRAVGKAEGHGYSAHEAVLGSDSSSSELSMDESPMSVHLQANSARRHHGKAAVGDFVVGTVTASVTSWNDTSETSTPLPVTIDQRRRSRSVGPVNSRVPRELNARDEVGVPLDSSESDEELPLNAELMLNLVRRFRDPALKPDDIPLEAFSIVNWDDDTFRPAMEPLRRLYEYYEAMSTLKATVASPALVAQRQAKLWSKAKEAIVDFPSEKAMQAVLHKVKTRAVSGSVPKYSVFRSDFVEGSHSDRGPSRAVGATKANTRPRALTTGANIGGAPVLVSEKAVPAATGKKRKVRSADMMMSSSGLDSSVKEGYLSASMSEIFKPSAKPLTSQKAKQRVLESSITEEPSKVRRAVPKRRKSNANRSISFSEVGFPDEAEAILEDEESTFLGTAPPHTAAAHPPANQEVSEKRNEGRIKKRRASRTHPGQSVSFASIPEDIAGEVSEDAPGLLAAATAARAEKSWAAARKKRPSNMGRSCSFSEVVVDDGGEVPDVDVQELTCGSGGARAAAVAAADDTAEGGAKGKKKVLRKRPVQRKNNLDMSQIDGDKAEEINEGATKLTDTQAKCAQAKSAHVAGTDASKRRRPSSRRANNISISAIDVVEAGEIFENPGDLEYLASSSRPTTAQAARAAQLAAHPVSRQPERRQAQRTQQSTTLTPHHMSPAPRAAIDPKAGVIQAAPRKRMMRKHTGQELSISLIPDLDAREVRDNSDAYLMSDSASKRPASKPGAKPGAKASVTLPRLAGAVVSK